MRLLDTELIEELIEIHSLIGGTVARRRDITVPVSTKIVSRDTAPCRHSRHYAEIPKSEACKQTVDHHDICTFAHLLEVELYAVYVNSRHARIPSLEISK